MDNNSIVEKVKELVAKGNVSRIVVKKDDHELVNIPVNVGVAGAVIGLAAAKWAVLAAVVATVGFSCSVYVVNDDGSITSILRKEDGDKVVDKAKSVVDEVRGAVNFDDVVDATVEQAKEDTPSEEKEKDE